MNVPLILQTERNECGLASVAMILNYHGYITDLHSLREKCPISLHGENLQTLMKIADECRMVSKAYQLEISDLPEVKLPAILHWDVKHFVVLKRIKGNAYYINDPAKGAVILKSAEISRHFTGVVLELEPGHHFVPTTDVHGLTLADIWRQTKELPLMSGLTAAFGLSIVLLLCSVVLPLLSQIIIDSAIGAGDKELAYVLAAGFAVLLLARQVTELVRSLLLMKIGTSVGFHFATKLYRHLLHLKYEFFARRHIGDISSRFRSLGSIQDFVSSGVVAILVDGILITITLTLMFSYSATLSMVALVPVALYAGLRMYSYRKIYRLNAELVASTAVENTVFIENIRAILGTKMFGREGERGLIWQNSYASATNLGIGVRKVTIVLSFLNSSIMGTGGIALLLLAGIAVISNQLSLGMMFAFLQFKDQFSTRISSLIDKCFDIKLLDVHLARLADIVFAKEEPQSSTFKGMEEVMPLPARPGERSQLLEVNGLSYRFSKYSGMLFQNVSFSLAPEESVAIVGPTGCGKSTLLKLILGLVQPEEGRITLLGCSFGDVGARDYRSRIAAVLQDDALVSGTIFENVSFFDPMPSIERVEMAARVACIHEEIVRLPLQYQTFVGTDGSALSAGQVQRIMIARAVYKNAQIMVLDEATSHLDMGTEKSINEQLQRLKVARVIVAHRPSAIVQADRVFELSSMGLKEVAKERYRSAAS